VESSGAPFEAGWRITARCAWGKREGMKTRRDCRYTRELETSLCRAQGRSNPKASKSPRSTGDAG
jgi:hypothetical protein